MAGKIKVPSELVPSQSNKIMLRSKYVHDNVKGHDQEYINNYLEEKIDSKVIAAGGVNWDTVPTAGSNNAIKSKDIKAALEKVTGYFVLDSNVLESTVVKTVTVADFPALAIGGSIKIKMLTKNTAANPTLRIGPASATAYPLYYNNERASADNSWEANEVISVYFDGTNYQASNAMGGGSAIGKKKLTGATGYIATDGDSIGEYNSLNTYRYIKYPVNPGDVVMISGKGGISPRLYAIAREDDTIIKKEETENVIRKGLVLVMPEEAKWIVLNNNYSAYPNYEWYFAKKRSVGAHEMLTEAYLYGDLRTIAVGETYKANEAVKTTDTQLIRMVKEIVPMTVVDTISIGDFKTYGSGASAATYKALKNLNIYDGTETEGLYAIGRPSLVTITVDSSSLSIAEDTDITVTIGNDSKTITVPAAASETKDVDIAALIAAAFTNIEGWVLTDNEDGTLTLKCNTAGNNTISVSSNTGETGLSITSSAVNGNSTLNQYNNGSWGDVTLSAFAGDYADIGVTDNTKMWQKLSIDDLISLNSVQNTLVKTSKAESTSYNNSQSGLTAYNVQDAIDELSEEFAGMLQPIELGAQQNGFLRVGTNGWQPMGEGDSAYQTHYLIIRTKEMRYIAITPNDGGIAQVGFFNTYEYHYANPTTTFSDIVSGRQEIKNDDPIKIPSDCNYIVINGYNTRSINRTPAVVKISYESNALEYNSVDVSTIKENVGAVDATTGNINTSVSTQFNADIIIPEGATQVNFQVFKTASVYGVAFLDNDGGFISGYYNTEVGFGTRITIDIPKHAAIFRFGYLTDAKDFDFVRFIVPIKNSVYANGIKTITPTIIDGYTINKSGTIAANSGYCYTTPIYLRAGETIVVISSTGGYSVISQTDVNGTVYAPLVFSTTNGANVVYEYTAWFDMYVALCYKKENAEIYLREKRSGTYYGGMYIFSFKTIANKDIWIYKDALFTGLKPLENYEVFVKNAEASFIKNQTKRALKFKATAGNYEVRIFARDIYNEVIFRKDIQVKVVNAPSTKLSAKSSFNVMFFGDSIIGNNNNKIGAEFLRYLSSNDAGGTNEDGSIQPAATNVCQSKMNLVGEMNLSNTRFQYLFKAETAMTGKRDLPYGDPNANNVSYFASHNPFYNPNSSQPDEIGQDGFNKRVDFGWYFQNACGNEKYPDLIYMSIGANDIGTSDTYWSGNSVSVTVERIIAICKKMKAACDIIAGGTSDMKIKIFNHQSYPLDFASYNNLPIEQARLVQTMYYTKLYYKIISEGISDYVEFVDCASKFDIKNGYDMGDVNSNSRTIKTNDYGLTGGDGVHMNQTGAFNYADCLINDFLADSNFD